MFKKFFILFFMASFLFAGTQLNIQVAIDGEMHNSELLLLDGMGYLKIDDVAKFFGAELSFGMVSQTAVLQFEKNTLEFQDDSTVILLNSNKVPVAKKSRVINKIFYIPLGFILSDSFTEASDFRASWNYDKKLLTFTSGKKVEQKKPEPLSKFEPKPKPTVKKESRIRTIVVDAGHGGKDPGAIAANGTREKDLNLILAKKVAKMLEQDYGKKVILTRDTDVFIPLRGRTQIANDNKADLFICIHGNAVSDRTRKGFEIYFLSEQASDDEAAAVAQYENAVMSYEEDLTSDVNTILWSMTLNEFINESSTLSFFINDNVKKGINDYQNRGVKQAGFAVLKGSKMPAVLIEIGYLTNLSDLSNMSNENFKDKMVKQIVDGIIAYEENLKDK